MTTVARQGAASTGPRAAPFLRAIVLGPRGGGTTRRRASDAVRLGFAVVVAAVSMPVMRANSAVELATVHALNPPPPAIQWLVTAVFWLGCAGVIACLAISGLLVPRMAAVRRIALAAVVTWAARALLAEVLGPGAGRPVTGALTGIDTSYPVTQLAVTIAVAATALPYLSRPLHRRASVLIAAATIAAVVDGSALPVNAVLSIAIGWGVAAALHLAVGSPLGLPSAEEVADGIADLRVTVENLARAPQQVWGAEKFLGHDATGNMIELSVYGRDATDARAVAKLWRYCFYRLGPTLILDRFQQVEHEAYMTFMAGRAGVLVPKVLAVGRFGPSGDAAIVSRLPGGPTLAQVHAADVPDSSLDELLRTVQRLRAAGIAHGALGAETIATEPRKIVYVLAGSVLSQLFVALALGASLHAVGEEASISTLLVVITTASLVGGAIPVPGRAGVVEAGLIAGLTSAGVPQDQAVTAVFIQRLFTAYLPPIWGWVTLAWMRRREYV